MANVTRQSSLSVQTLLPHHRRHHINFHSAGEKGFVGAILQQSEKPLERLMNLPLSDNSTDHLTTNATPLLIWSWADMLQMLAFLPKCCDKIMCSLIRCQLRPCLAWTFFITFLGQMLLIPAYSYHWISSLAHAVTCLMQQNKVKMINNLKPWSTPSNTPFLLWWMTLSGGLQSCRGKQRQIKQPKRADSSPCISTPEISVSV